MYARTIVASIVPGKADEAVAHFRDQVVPMIRQQPGYVRTAIYLDREHNLAETVSVWESREAVEATGERSSYLAKAVAALRPFLVNKEYGQWEVAFEDTASRPAPEGPPPR